MRGCYGNRASYTIDSPLVSECTPQELGLLPSSVLGCNHAVLPHLGSALDYSTLSVN